MELHLQSEVDASGSAAWNFQMGAQPQNSAGCFGNYTEQARVGKGGPGTPKCRSREGSRVARGFRVHSRLSLGAKHPFSEKKPRQSEGESALLGTQNGGLAEDSQWALKQ